MLYHSWRNVTHTTLCSQAWGLSSRILITEEAVTAHLYFNKPSSRIKKVWNVFKSGLTEDKIPGIH